MKLNLPHAKDLDKPFEEQKSELDEIIERWINEEVTPKIVETHREAARKETDLYIAIEPPHEVDIHSTSELFYERLDELLNPFGYTVEKSHDGANVYEVTLISWKVGN